MSDDERNDLMELKAFLEKAILLVNEDIILFPYDGKESDYQFLTNKAVMYRDNLRTVVELLETDINQ